MVEVQRGKEKKTAFLQNALNQISKFLSPLYMWHHIQEANYEVMAHQATFPIVVVLPPVEKLNGFCIAGSWIYDAKDKDFAMELTRDNLTKLGYYAKNGNPSQEQTFEVVSGVRHYAVVLNHDWVKHCLTQTEKSKQSSHSQHGQEKHNMSGTSAEHSNVYNATAHPASQSHYPTNSWGRKNTKNA